MTRLEQIIRLLQTRDDNLPQPSRRPSYTTAGFVHNAPARETCEDCLTNGRTLPTCETCGGRGYTEYRRERDPYAIEKVVPYGLQPAAHEQRRDTDAQIARLEQQLAPPFATPADELAHANKHPEPWEIARRHMYRAYDYAALDHALEQLRQIDEGAYHALHACYVYAWAEPSAGYEHAVTRGLDHLDRELPTPLRAPNGDTHPALERRAKREAA